MRKCLQSYLVQGAHGCRCWGNDIVDEEEECILGTQVNAFTYKKIELAHSQIGGYQILLFVQITNARLRCFLNDHLQANRHGKIRNKIFICNPTIIIIPKNAKINLNCVFYAESKAT